MSSTYSGLEKKLQRSGVQLSGDTGVSQHHGSPIQGTPRNITSLCFQGVLLIGLAIMMPRDASPTQHTEKSFHCTFPIYLTQIKIPIGAKSIGRV